jgi:LPXTG-motif cell wall-anchored protein
LVHPGHALRCAPMQGLARASGKVFGAAALAVMALLVAAVPAAAAGSISVSPTSVAAGGTVSVSGSVAGGCSPGADVTLISKAFNHAHDFAGLPAITTASQSNGEFSVSTQIPSTTAPGSYSVSGRCGGGNFGSAPFQVTAASSTLPRTGLAAWTLAWVGICLLAGGVALRHRTRLR